MPSRAFALLILCLAAQAASGQIYKWTDERGRVHYSETPPVGEVRGQIFPSTSAHAVAQPQTGVTGAIPSSSLPKLPPEEVERRRRLVEQMDSESREKEKAAFRQSEQGRRICAMLQQRVREAESGVLRGQDLDRKLTPAEQAQIVPALRNEYAYNCQ